MLLKNSRLREAAPQLIEAFFEWLPSARVALDEVHYSAGNFGG
jgi:hypothetical protein